MVDHLQLKYERVFKVLENIFTKKKQCEQPLNLYLFNSFR